MIEAAVTTILRCDPLGLARPAQVRADLCRRGGAVPPSVKSACAQIFKSTRIEAMSAVLGMATDDVENKMPCRCELGSAAASLAALLLR